MELLREKVVQFYISIVVMGINMRNIKDMSNAMIKKMNKMVAEIGIINTLDKKTFTVLMTMSKEKTQAYDGKVYIDKVNIMFSIIKDDLIEKGYALKGYESITFRRQKYNVISIGESAYDNRISVKCEILNSDKNNG